MSKQQTLFKSFTRVVPTGCGKLYITIAKKDDGLIEKITAECGKSGTCVKNMLSVICELLTIVYNHPNRQEAIAALNKACGHHCQFFTMTCTGPLLREILDMKLEERENG